MLISNASDADWRSLLKARTPSKASIQVSKMELIVFFDKETPPVNEWNRAFFASWLEFGDNRIFNTWCGDPGKVCHCYFWLWASWLFCCWAFHWKWCMEKNVDLIAFFKGSSPWCRPWDHRKGKLVSGNPGCRRYIAERFQLSTTGNIQLSQSMFRSQPAGEVAPRQVEELARPRNLLRCWLQVVQFSRNIMKIMMEEILCWSWW